jgi:hypothetical protein
MENNKNSAREDFKIIGNWDKQSNALKEKFPQLTMADLKIVQGKESEMLTRVQDRLKKGREEVINIIKKGQPEQGKAQ